MKSVIFVTGNRKKADNFSKYMGASIGHHSADLDEIQTLDVKKLVEHKVKQAYEQLRQPVLVEDVTFTFDVTDGLPGPFIKFYINAQDGLEIMCRMLDSFENRDAIASCTYGYFNGSAIKFFTGSLRGSVARHPRGSNGYGFDPIFQPDGFGGKTAAELDEHEYDKYYSTIKPFTKVKEFLESNQ